MKKTAKTTDAFFPKRSLHIDFHTMPDVYDVGRDFDANEFGDTLKKARIEYVTVFARCNLGFAYYPTKVGTVHPGLKFDLLGRMIKACHDHKIEVAVYLNAGLDHEHALRHRDWCKVNKQGQVFENHTMGHWFRKMCLNSEYRTHLLSMIEEVLEWYLVDGLFLDCFDSLPCYGVECFDKMKRLGMDISDDQEIRRFTRISSLNFIADVKKLVDKKRKGIRLCFNGLPRSVQPTHNEIEVLPTGGWGYDFLPWSIRYCRTLGKPYLTMTGRFHKSWGDFGGLRPKHAFFADCYNSICNAGTCSVGDHLHPRGKLESEVYGLIGEVYAQLETLDPWTDNAKSFAEMAIVAPTLREKSGEEFDFSSIAGATRILMELNYQFDVSDGDGDMSGYKILILPDDVLVDENLKKKLQRHLDNGGILISSAFAGLETGKKSFALDDYGITCELAEPYTPTFFQAGKKIGRDLPKMLTTIYEPGIAMKAKKGAKTLAKVHKPYFNRSSWDGYHENLYTPPEKDTGRAALIQCGSIFHFSFPIFKGYFKNALIHYKTLVRNCIEEVFPNPLVRVNGLPSFGQVTVTHKVGSRMVHFLTYVPELRGEMQIIEEPICIRDIELALRADGQQVKKVYLAPNRTPLDFHENGNYIHVVVPEVNGYQMVVFED